MIKHFLYGIALSIVAFTFTSCEDTNGDNFKTDSDSGYVQFVDNEQINFMGGFHTTLEVPVNLHTNTNLAGLDVYYKIDNISGDINSVIVKNPGFVHFEPGQNSATTKIEVKSDIPEEGFKFRITLTYASRNNIDFIDNVETIYLTKEVCLSPIILVTNYVGDIYMVDLAEDGSMKEPEYATTITTSLVLTDQANVYNISNGAWGTEFMPLFTSNPGFLALNYPADIQINDDGSVLVIGGDQLTPSGNTYMSKRNRGSVNPCTREITYFLQQELFQENFLVKVVIRPAN